MISDILTVMWKEKRSFFNQQANRTVAFTLLVPAIVFGIFLPWQEGRNWVGGFFSVITSVFIPLLFVGTIISESIAGERERHTLETLLASRLPDRAILLGKLGFAVICGWLMTLAVLTLGLLTVNIFNWGGHFILFSPNIFIINICISLLLASLMANLGVLVSLHASTAQGAMQILTSSTLLPLLLIGVLITSISKIEPGLAGRIFDFMASIKPLVAILIVITVLLFTCLILFWISVRRFQRHRLLNKR